MGAPPRISKIKCLKGSEGVMEWIRPTTTTWKIINIFHVKKGPNKHVTTTFCLKLSFFCKVFYTNVRMLWGNEASSFHFYKPFSFLFWFRVVFLWRSPLTWNQKGFKFPAFLELASDITSFISEKYPTIFPTALWLWRIKTIDFNILISSQCLVQFFWNFRICLFYIYFMNFI